MKPGFVVVLWLALGLTCRGASVPLQQIENMIRVQMETEPHVIDLDKPRPPPLHEEVLGIAKRTEASQQELETVLFNLVDSNVAADVARGASGRALGLLAEIGSATALDRVTAIALNGPVRLRGAARSASLGLANREAPERLPELARQLLRSDPEKNAYGTLHHILRERLSTVQGERERRIVDILAIFKEGLRDESYSNRIYLDRVLDEFDAIYRSSEERHRFLVEESQSKNPIVKKYADTKRRNWSTGVPTASAKAGSDLLKAAVNAPITPENAEKQDYAGEKTMISISMIIGAIAALGVLSWLLWKAISR